MVNIIDIQIILFTKLQSKICLSKVLTFQKYTNLAICGTHAVLGRIYLRVHDVTVWGYKHPMEDWNSLISKKEKDKRISYLNLFCFNIQYI